MSLKQDPFYKAALDSASRKLDRRLEQNVTARVVVRVKQKTEIAAGGNGVFVIFSSEGNRK